jgi:high-affinity iron transporter
MLLDYVAVDYGGVVSSGKVLKDSEYAEMQEFAAAARRDMGELPQDAASESLRRRAVGLENAIANKAEPALVARLARNLASELRSAFPFVVAPATAPDAARGAHLYQELCVACHGSLDRGDGPLAAGLKVRPTVRRGGVCRYGSQPPCRRQWFASAALMS